MCKLVFIDTELQIHLVYDFHLGGSELLAPLLELVLDLLLHLVLPSFEHSIVFVEGVHASHLFLLSVHCVIHVHEDLHLQRDLLHHIFLLPHVVTLVSPEKRTLRAHTLPVKDADQLQRSSMLSTRLHKDRFCCRYWLGFLRLMLMNLWFDLLWLLLILLLLQFCIA